MLMKYFLVFLKIYSIQSRLIRLSTVNTSESIPIGTSIIRLIDQLPSLNWNFAFVTSYPLISYFLLDQLKGTITIKRHLDREQICQLNFCSCQINCQIKLEINAISNISIHILTLPILIFDENDNLCSFSNEIYFFNLTENLPINTRISLPFAYDPDLYPNNIQFYQILEKNLTNFQLENSHLPAIRIINLLDRELFEQYSFNLCAYEGIQIQRFCCTKIQITIIDINDNPPIFIENQRNLSIIYLSESMPIETEFIQMKALDFDKDLNGQIRYSFTSISVNLFEINSINGSIRLKTSFDYEKQTKYELQIRAFDLGENSLSSLTTLIIQILDENDCSPEIFVFPSSNIQLINDSLILINENYPINSSIIYLTVSDQDSGENGRVSIELSISSDIFELEQISNNTYRISSKIEFDREIQSNYSFSLNIYDHGKPIHLIIKKFELIVLDVNDCFPYFHSLMNSTFEIDENNPKNFIVETIRVFDDDENDRIQLFVNKFEDLFSINNQNQLIIQQSLDFENQSIYEFDLIAQDLGGHRTNISIKIFIRNLNDNPVEFRNHFLEIPLQINQPIGSLFCQIFAKDKDEIGEIIYSIDVNDQEQVRNLIELKSNGQLLTKKRFLSNEFLNFRFHILANDSKYTDKILIHIRITNQSIIKPQSPVYFSKNFNEQIIFHLQTNQNYSFSMKNPSSKDLILHSNGTLIFRKTSSFDIYLHENDHYLIFQNFILKNQSESSWIFAFLIIFILCFFMILFYFREKPTNLSSSTYVKICNELLP